jgi:hypothetical protein
MQSWFVSLIGGLYISKSRQFFWWTKDSTEAEKSKTDLDATKLCDMIARSSGFPLEALQPHFSIQKVTVSVEDVPLRDISPDTKEQPKALPTETPPSVGQEGT